MLITHAGEVVAREDLRLRLWPGMRSGNFEHGVNAAVNKLRLVLGDTANEARYIETLAGRGYRFVSPISLASGGVVELVPARAELPPEPRPSRRRVVAGAGAGAALAVLAALVVFWLAGQRSTVSLKAARFLIPHPKGSTSKRVVSGNPSLCRRMANGSPSRPKTRAARSEFFFATSPKPSLIRWPTVRADIRLSGARTGSRCYLLPEVSCAVLVSMHP